MGVMKKHWRLEARLAPGDPGYGLCRCGCQRPTSIAKKGQRGFRVGDHYDWIRGHQQRKLDLRAAFEEFVYPEPNTGCFLWGGRGNMHGYGTFNIAWSTAEAD